MTGIGNLIYREDARMRAFLSEGFNFAYDKGTFTSLTWGRTPKDDVMFDPIGPEAVTMAIGPGYSFSEEGLRRLVALDTGDGSSFASTLTAVRLRSAQPEGLFAREARRLADWLEGNGVFVECCMDCAYAGKLRNLMKAKSLGARHIRVVSAAADRLARRGQEGH